MRVLFAILLVVAAMGYMTLHAFGNESECVDGEGDSGISYSDEISMTVKVGQCYSLPPVYMKITSDCKDGSLTYTVSKNSSCSDTYQYTISDENCQRLTNWNLIIEDDLYYIKVVGCSGTPGIVKFLKFLGCAVGIIIVLYVPLRFICIPLCTGEKPVNVPTTKPLTYGIVDYHAAIGTSGWHYSPGLNERGSPIYGIV